MIAFFRPDIESSRQIRVRRRWALRAAVVLAAASPAFALPQDCNFFVDRDTFIRQDNPNQNRGSQNDLRVGRALLPFQEQRALLHANLSAIPPGAPITSATLWVYVDDGDLIGLASVHRITSPWTENGATWNNIASAYAPPSEGGLNVASPGWHGVNLTSLVSAWHAGTYTNHGVMIFATTIGESRIRSREDSNDTPACLEIGYTAADLTINKDDGVTSYVPGTQVTYTITVSNSGPSSVAGATVTDLVTALPQVVGASWTCAGSGGATCSAGPIAGDINDTVSLPTGTSVTYTLTANLASGATGDLVNAALVSPPSGTADPNPANNSSTDTDSQLATVYPADCNFFADRDTYLKESDPSSNYGFEEHLLSRLAAPDQYRPLAHVDVSSLAPGSTIQSATLWFYVEDVDPSGNARLRRVTGDWTEGGATWTNMAANFQPAVVAFVDASSTGWHGADVTALVQSWHDATYPNHGVMLFATGNTLSVFGSREGAQRGPCLALNYSPPLTAEVSVTKNDGVASYVPGGQVAYAITVSNAGPIDVSGATVSDAVTALPQVAGVSWTCVGSGGATCTAGPISGDINDTVSLPTGTSVTYTLTATLASGATGDLINTATVSLPSGIVDSNPSNNSATDTDTRGAPSADLSVTKSDGVATYVPGGQLTYTITVSNSGPGDIAGATVSDAITAVPQVVSAAWTCVGTGGATCAAGPVAGDLGDVVALPAGTSVTYSMVADLDSAATGDLVNTATVSLPSGAADPNPANNSATDADRLGTLTADLAIDKNDGVTSYLPGGQVTYTITVKNGGPSDISGATVSDSVTGLPQVTGASWTCAASAGASCASGPVAGDLNDTVVLAANAFVTYTLIADLDPGATGDLVNTATVSAPPGVVDANSANNSSTDTDTLGTSSADLSVTKSDGVTSYVPGSQVTYTITVSNAGPSDVSGATVSDAVTALPQVTGASWTCSGTGGASCTAGPITGDINEIVGLPAGSSVTYTLVASLNSSATGNLINTATASLPSGTADSNVANNSATDTDTQGTSSADLSVTKSDGVASYVAGGQVTYTITVSNAGPSDVSGATVSDAVTALPQVTSASWTCSGTGGASCTAGPITGDINEIVGLPAGSSVTYTLVASLNSSATGNLINTATASLPSGTADPNPANNSSTDTDTQGTSSADLSVTKSDGVASYVAGGQVTYTITVSNAGPSDVSGATVSDAVTGLAQVAGASWTCVSAGGASCTAGPVTGDINDTVGLPVGTAVTYSLTVDLGPGATGDLVNTATVSLPSGTVDTNPSNNSATDTDTLGTSSADLSVTKSDGVTSYVPGSQVTYTITVSNAGPSDVSGATVSDAVTALPQVTGASWTCSGTGGASCTAGPITGDINDIVGLPAGTAVTYALSVDLGAGATGDLVNTASVSLPSGVTDLNPANNSAMDTDTRGASSADLAVTKSDGVASYVAGGQVTYTITVSNAGPSDVSGATVSDAVTALPQVTSASWTCSGTGGASCTAGPITGDINEIVGLPAGSSVTYTLVASLNSSATGNLINTATASLPSGTADSNVANNSATDTDTLGTSSADLSITKSDGVASYVAGGQVTYTITVSNAGPSDVTGATVSDAVTALPQVTGASWTCAGTGGATCTTGPITGDINDTVGLPAGTAVTYTLTVDLGPGATGDLVNTATVSPPSATVDPNPANNTATDTDTLGAASADLSLSLTTDLPQPTLGAAATFTITVSNNGPSEAQGVAVVFRNPASYVYATHSGTGIYDPIAGSWQVGPVQSGASVGLSITATVQNASDHTSTAEITASSVADPDSTPGNGVVSGEDDSASIVATPDVSDALALLKQAGKPKVLIGESVPYSITVSNSTDQDQLDVRIEDQPAPGFRFVPGSARVDGVPIPDPAPNRPLVFFIGTVAAQSQTVLSYLLQVGSGAVPGIHLNRAAARNACCALSHEARADIEVRADSTLDLGTLIGKVFADADGDGRQDPGETGVANAMVALDDGTYAITDPHGRYHFPAVHPGQRLVKLNAQSLPAGATVADIRRVVVLTPGLMMTVDFPVSVRSESTTIGAPEQGGVSIRSEAERAPVEVTGNADALSVFVNAQRVPIRSGDVRLEFRTLDDTIHMTAGDLDQPVRFRIEPDSPEIMAEWELRIFDEENRVVRAVTGNGPPPGSIEWDGRLDDGSSIRPGQLYAYQLQARWIDEAAATSPRRLFGVNVTSLIELDLMGEAFETASDRLSPKATEVLANAALTLRAHPHERVVLEGHTDSFGSRESNLNLSRRRAESAVKYLVESHGFPRERFVVRAYGEDRPVASNAWEDGRALNRRVEIRGEFKEVERSSVARSHRESARVVINGEDVSVGPLGEFRKSVELEGASRLEIGTSDPQGRSNRVTVKLPRIEIASPRGVIVVPLDGSSDGCRSAPAGIACRIQGSTDAGNTLEASGKSVDVEPDGTFVHDIALQPGRNRLDLLVRGRDGFTRAASVQFTVSDAEASGRRIVLEPGVPELTIQLPAEGTKLSSCTLPVSGMTAPGNRVEINGKDLPVGSDGGFAGGVDLPPGKSTIIARVTDPEGRTGTVERRVEAPRHQLFLLAFADETVGHLSREGAIDGPGSADDSYSNGRIAFYLKGRIAGKYLITSAYDSAKDSSGEVFDGLDRDQTGRLLTNLDPDKLYPVYGDESAIVYDAESQGKFYLGLDSDEIHVVIGNYPIALTDTELATYQRTLYGGRFAYRSLSTTRYGDADTEVVVFGADLKNTHVRDELQATGGSLYYLSQSEIVQGSEEVTLVVRDRNTGLVILRQRQRQNFDYTVKYDEGRIMFHRPISAVAESGALTNQALLSGNPVFIQVDYESVSADLNQTAAGGRFRQQIGDHVAVGGTYVQDELSGGSYELRGADAEFRLAKGTRLVAEVADSTGSDSLVHVSVDGGLSYALVPTTGQEEGSAWKATAEVDVGEWFDKPGRYRARVYFRDVDPGFFASGSLQDQGSQKMGASAFLTLTESDSVQLRFDSERRTGPASVLPGAPADSVTSAAMYTHSAERWNVAAELFDSASKDASGQTLRSSTLGSARFSMDFTEKLRGSLELQQTLSGDENDQTSAGLLYRPTEKIGIEGRVTDGTLGTSAQIGASMNVGDTTVYVSERLVEDAAGDKTATVLGARAPIGKGTRVYTEYQWEDSELENRQTSLVGLQRQWEIGPGLRLSLAAESANVQSAQQDAKRTALSAVVAWSAPERFTVSSRNEIRFEDGTKRQEQWFTSSQLDYRLNDDFSALGRFRFSRTEDRDTGDVEARFSEGMVGLAFRPVSSDRFNALFKLTSLADLRPLGPSAASQTDRRMDVLSLDTSFRIAPRLEWLAKGAARRLSEQLDDVDIPASTIYLTIQRLQLEVWKRFSLAAEYRIFVESDAEARRQGMLLDAGWQIHPNFRAGVGYDFTDFSENLFSANNYTVRGWFLRLQGMY